MRSRNNSTGASTIEYAILVGSSALLLAVSSFFLGNSNASGTLLSKFSRLEMGGGSGGSGVVDAGGCDFTQPTLYCSSSASAIPD